MKKNTGHFRPAAAALLAAALLAAGGCRREDFRVISFDVPGMDASNTAKIAEALRFYEGIDQKSVSFDLERKILTVRFDRMKVAQTNIRMAIEAKGVKVAWPEKTGPAGYIDKRPE